MGLRTDDKCLAKVADDEPIFVLRAQDKLAPGLVRHWIALAVLCGSPDTVKIREAYDLADAMEAWQRRTLRAKFPD